MTTFLLNIIYSVVEFFLNIFPVSTGYPEAFSNAFKSIGGALYTLDPLIPVDTLGVCVAVVLGVEFAYWAFKALSRVFSHIPVVGGTK